jgi:hypothetical protein
MRSSEAFDCFEDPPSESLAQASNPIESQHCQATALLITIALV